MNAPALDPRSREDVMELLARRAAAYTPEWRYEPEDGTDPGAAIAQLYGDMFYQTIDRFNDLPKKTYTAFLELLGVRTPPITSAEGYMQFDVHTGLTQPVAIPEGTQVFYRNPDGDNVIYETERRIEATPAKLEHVFYCDVRQGMLQELDLSREQRFFAPNEGENLQRHRFLISQNDVLALRGPCEIQVRFHQSAQFLEVQTAKQLADETFARWSYLAEGELRPFDSVTAQGGSLLLEKRSNAALEAREDGRICLYCDMGSQGGSLTVDGVSLSSRPLEDLEADSLSNNDIPIAIGEGGYCFGRRPMAYETFYVRSDPVFCKKGATVRVRLDLSVLAWSEVDSQPQYEFTRRIIDKQDAVVVKPDDVYVQQVVWEYYNGMGWAGLTVAGDRNPFDGQSEGPQELRFQVPADITTADVNARTGYYIRARVVHVENFMSANPRWLLPFIKTAVCAWSYEDNRDCPADYLSAENNGSLKQLEATNLTHAALEVYAGMADHPRAMYLCFSLSPNAMPLSMRFGVRGKGAAGSKLSWEMWTGSRFEPLRSIDQSRNLTHTGPVFLYVTQSLPEQEFFGVRGFWLRVSRSAFDEPENTAPWVQGVEFNTVNAIQKQRAKPQYFTAQIYDAGKRISLLHTPVLESQVWIDEVQTISQAELEALEASWPQRIQVTREGGVVTSCKVLWESVASLSLAGPEDRVYLLDSGTGSLTFGDGRQGKVPPQGDTNIRVEYTYGGGSAGNVPAGAVTSFMGSVPRISALRNRTPMSGGTDEMDAEKLQDLGSRRIRHRFRAVGVSDFEDLVLENFPQVLTVRCFSGRDENGSAAPGHVTVVAMCGDEGGERAAAVLCERIYNYLQARTDCAMVAAGRLHVRPSTVITVNAIVSVQLRDLDQAAATQQQVADAVTELIDQTWRSREIGSQIQTGEVWRAIKSVTNVAAITSVLLEGVYYADGRLLVRPIEDESEFLYATVRSGTHTVKYS